MEVSVEYAGCYETITALTNDLDYQLLKAKLGMEVSAREIWESIKPVVQKVFDFVTKISKDICKWFSKIYRYPAKNVIRLALYGKKWRVRKKNAKRIMRYWKK